MMTGNQVRITDSKKTMNIAHKVRLAIITAFPIETIRNTIGQSLFLRYSVQLPALRIKRLASLAIKEVRKEEIVHCLV